MRVETSFQLMGYSGLAILCFLAAAAGGFWQLISTYVQDRQRAKRATR